MTSPAVDVSIAEQLSVPCDCRCHIGRTPPAAAWGLGMHGCNSIVRCDHCYQMMRINFATHRYVHCEVCGRKFETFDSCVPTVVRL